MKRYSSTIHPFWWLWLPILFMLGQVVIEFTVPRELKPAMHSEWGPHETLQSIILLAAFIIGIVSLVRVDWKTQKEIGLWIALATLCCFYVSGEEISWGQHILNWQTPEHWAQYNDQNETNLHNTSAWLDQKPRLLLFLGIVVGGLIVPALRRWKPESLPRRFEKLYPPDVLSVTALFVTVPYILQEIAEAFGKKIFWRESELQELYMYYFVMLYLWDLRAREIPKNLL